MPDLDPQRGVACVVGTRPEVVKMAPVLLRLRRVPSLRLRLISTGQHRELLDQALAEFGLQADLDLNLMRPDQTPAQVLARGIEALAEPFRTDPPAAVLAQGDTTTVLCAALAAFYARIPFGHVEAGLRTGRSTPFPEERQRVLVSHLAAWHFAPTHQARRNLLREAIDPASIHLTGNTVIDALRLFDPHPDQPIDASPVPPLLLITAHRRENFGPPLRRVCQAIDRLLLLRPDLTAVWPVHPNPHVHDPVHAAFGRHPRVRLLEPQAYGPFVRLMARADVIVTDSGGVQEEAPSLGKPVVILREETERGEGVAAGGSFLVGTDPDAVVATVLRLLEPNPNRPAQARDLVGDGWAAERIARALLPSFQLDPGPEPLGFTPDWNPDGSS